MNALDRIFMNAGKHLRAARIVGVAAMATLLSGCLSEPIASVKIDPDSPVAPEVAKMASGPLTYPQFSDIPPQPTDLRAPRVYGQRAKELETARSELDAATAPNTWSLANTQGFLNRARSDAGPNYTPPTLDTEGFANTVRKRATPPPPAGN